MAKTLSYITMAKTLSLRQTVCMSVSYQFAYNYLSVGFSLSLQTTKQRHSPHNLR